jgi:site-specific recombinase XerD
MNTLKYFVVWLDEPIEEVRNKKVLQYIDFLLDKAVKPKTINCHLDSIRGFYNYLCMECYARKAGLKVSCHHLRHTMATQLLNADMRLVSLQDLLGHDRVKTTQRYSKVSNLTVMRDYFKAMEVILKRMGGGTGIT